MRPNAPLFLSLLVSSLAAAQNNNNNQPITQAISNRRNLSTFRSIIAANPALQDALAERSAQGKTLFIPTDAAFRGAGIDVNTVGAADLAEIIRYHIVNGTVSPQTLNKRGGSTLETYLDDGKSANVGGGGRGNVLFVSRYGDTGVGAKRGGSGELDDDDEGDDLGVQVFTGLGQTSSIEGVEDDDDLNDIDDDNDDDEGPGRFADGLFYPISSIFTLPRNCSTTAASSGWLNLLEAFTRTNLTSYVDTVPRITCFAPSDAAFAKAGNPHSMLSPDDLTKALQRHTLVGDYIAYSDLWGDIGSDGVQHETLAGNLITLRRDNDGLYVDGVKVSRANVLVSNGVAHVLEEVLPEPSEGNATGTTTRGGSTPTESGAGRPSDNGDGNNNGDGQGAAGRVEVGYGLMAMVMLGALVGF